MEVWNNKAHHDITILLHISGIYTKLTSEESLLIQAFLISSFDKFAGNANGKTVVFG
jgi:hypothetical protein